MTRVALCFPGQGSQAAGMADGLLDEALAVALLDTAAAAGLDLRAALQGEDDDLRPTEVAQPALLLVELVLAAALPPDLDIVGVAGHSVGEYAAVSVAGAFRAEDALRLVIQRGRAMAAMTDGTMAAVLGVEEDTVEAACASVRGENEVVVIGNVNAPGQVVISGSRAGVDRAGRVLLERGARRIVPLNVSGAFHSPLMAPAAADFSAVIAATPCDALRLPVVCNVGGVVVEHARDLPALLARQLESPVRWTECVRALVGLGAEVLVEVGPGSVLSGLARRIDRTVRTVSINDLQSARAFHATLGVPA